MRLIASVVFFNPTPDCIERARLLLTSFDYVVVVDNSSTVIDAFEGEENISYIPLHENRGIAFALNVALSFAKENDFDFLMTFDQDSVYPHDKHNLIKESLCNQPKEVAIYSLDPEGRPRSRKLRWQEPNFAITSGSFLRLDFFRKHPVRFCDELFIDCVDFEFNRQVLLAGGKIVENHDITFGHTIGNPIVVKILWKKIHCMNHVAIRDYYRFRNVYYLYHIDKKFYKKLYRETMLKGRLVLRFFEPQGKEKYKMAKKGINDAKRGILGQYLSAE